MDVRPHLPSWIFISHWLCVLLVLGFYWWWCWIGFTIFQILLVRIGCGTALVERSVLFMRLPWPSSFLDWRVQWPKIRLCVSSRWDFTGLYFWFDILCNIHGVDVGDVRSGCGHKRWWEFHMWRQDLLFDIAASAMGL